MYLIKISRDASVYNGNIPGCKQRQKPVARHSFYPERLTAIPGIISTGVLQVTDADNNHYQLTGSLVDNRFCYHNFCNQPVWFVAHHFLLMIRFKNTGLL